MLIVSSIGMNPSEGIRVHVTSRNLGSLKCGDTWMAA